MAAHEQSSYERSSIRVLIADDEPHFRHGLRAVLQMSDANIDVIGEVDDGDAAVAETKRLDPDVVILDVHMPDHDGLTAARTLEHEAPRTRVLMLTVSDSPDDVALAARAGAAGYLLKERSLDDITDAVVSLARGRPWPLAAG